MSYDTVCMNEECIRQQRAFFQCGHQNYHISNNHTVKSIHPLTFISLFKKQQTSPNHRQEADSYLYGQLNKLRDEAFQTVMSAVKELLYESIMPNFQQDLALCRNLDVKTLIAKMSEGNYSLLHYLKHFQEQKEETNFKTFIIKSINLINSEMQLHITYIKDRLIDLCFSLKAYLMPKQSMVPQQPQQVLPCYPSFNKSSMDHEEDNASPQVKIQDCNRYLLQTGYYTYEKQGEGGEPQNQSESQSGQQKDVITTLKTKPIPKQFKKIKKRRKNYKISQEIQPNSLHQVTIKQCRYPSKTIQFLSENFPQLTTLHIFSQKMASSQAITLIAKTFPKLQRITINCNFQFQSEVFESFDKIILNKLKIELRWDMNKFFTDYFAYKNFPNKPLRKQQRKKKIDFQSITKYLPSNNSIWVYDNQFLTKLHDLPIKFSNITSLYYCPIGKYEKFLFSYKFQQIRVLVLKNINFYESIQVFDQFVDINKHLKVIVIADCFFSFITLSKFLINMKKIKNLVKLSLTLSEKKSSAPQINPDEICSLVSLTHLNIERYTFKNSSTKDFAKLTRLKHLGLYECQITSDLLNNLSPKCYPTLQYLNIGKTFVGNSAAQSLRQMNQLRYLNIDCTRIKGDVLVQVFKYMAKQSEVIIPLKYLSIQILEKLEGKSQTKITKENLQEIAKYVPNLSYMNIAFNENLSTYDFADFKNLKTLAVDKDQIEKLQEIISHEIVCSKIN